MTDDQAIRLECLRLAAAADELMDVADTLARARAYAEFVLGQEGERDA